MTVYASANLKSQPRVSMVIAIMCAVLFAGSPAVAETPALQDPEANRIAKEALLLQYEHPVSGNVGGKLNQPPGISCAVAVDNKLVWAEGLGFADLEQRVPVTPQTKFRIGSVSKLLTAAGAALLWQQGRLDIDIPIQRYVPSFPDKGYPITIRELAAHLGGIRHYQDKDFANGETKHYSSLLESLAIFKDDPLVAPPGTTYKYSSYGYNLIGAAIEAASGQKFTDFMQEHVFAPLAMHDTTFDYPEKIIYHRARGYDMAGDSRTYRNADYIDSSYKWPSGGMLSTPSDLALFGAAMLHPGFLSEKSVGLLFTPQPNSSEEEGVYGFGWKIWTFDAGFGPELIYRHGGDIEGGHALIIAWPEYGIVSACAMNTDDFNFGIRSQRLVVAPFIDQQKRRHEEHRSQRER